MSGSTGSSTPRKSLGLTQDTLRKILNISIGTIEATPLEMATVMSTIANMGVKQTPIFVSKIVNRDGITILDDSVRPGDPVLAADVAACTQNVLRGVITGGTGGAAAVAGHTAYGKTGTTDQHDRRLVHRRHPAARDRGVVRVPSRSRSRAPGSVARARRRSSATS